MRASCADWGAVLTVQGYSGGCSADPPGQSGAGAQCHELLSAACRGSDHALPLPLPHTRVLAAKKGVSLGCDSSGQAALFQGTVQPGLACIYLFFNAFLGKLTYFY